MDTFLHQVFSVFAHVFEERFWKASEQLFKECWCNFETNMLAMRGSDLTMKVSGQIGSRGPPQVARVPQCARIAIRHPDLQKHKVF